MFDSKQHLAIDDIFTSTISKLLIPLLDALNWKGNENKLLQSMGNYENKMGVDDLIDVMANLNFGHQKLGNIKVKSIDTEFLPLLVIDKKKAFLIIQMDQVHALTFNPDKGMYENILISKMKGDVYSFKYVGDSNESFMNQESNWFTKLMLRFTKSFKTLTFLTFVMTVLDLLIPMFIILIYDQIGSQGDSHTMLVLLVGVLLYFLSTTMLEYYRSIIVNYVSVRMGNVISQQTFRRLLYLTPGYTETASISSQINRMKDFENLKRFTNSGIFINILELAFSGLYVIAIFFLAGWLAIIPIMTLVIVLILGFIMKPINKVRVEKTSLARADQQRNLLEILKNTQEIKTSSMKDYWLEKFKGINAKGIYKVYDQNNFVSSSNNIVYFITNASVIAIIYGGVLQVFDNQMTMGALIGVILLYWKILASIRGASSLLVQVNGLSKSIQQINRFMKLPQDTSLKANMVLTKDIKGKVLFKDVSIRYNKTSKAALININFIVKPGEILGIRGHDGAGKTTILKLMLGMYVPQGGRIVIDDLNIKQLEPLTLRQSISYAPERDLIFSGSIRSNFRNVNPSITDQAILDLAEKTGLKKYMDGFDYDLDTILNESIIMEISPSFKKLFCLTRLLVRDVNFYLIDEPENHLDKDEIKKIVEVIKELSLHQKTVIVASKVDLILKECNQVIQLNQGRSIS